MTSDKIGYSLLRFLADLAVVTQLFCMAILLYWWGTNTFSPSSRFENPVLQGSSVVQPGDFVTVKYRVVRYRTCTLEINRVVEASSDRREFLLQSIIQPVVVDNPPLERDLSYNVQLPYDLAPGEYKLFTRVRFYCNGLDWLWPRLTTTPKLDLTVVPLESARR